MDQVGDIRVGWIVQAKVTGKEMTIIGTQKTIDGDRAELISLSEKLSRHAFDGTGHKKINLIRDHFKYIPLYNN